MVNLSEHFGSELASVRRAVRRSAHAQRARLMLVAAGLSAFGMVAVAAALLIHVT